MLIGSLRNFNQTSLEVATLKEVPERLLSVYVFLGPEPQVTVRPMRVEPSDIRYTRVGGRKQFRDYAPVKNEGEVRITHIPYPNHDSTVQGYCTAPGNPSLEYIGDPVSTARIRRFPTLQDAVMHNYKTHQANRASPGQIRECENFARGFIAEVSSAFFEEHGRSPFEHELQQVLLANIEERKRSGGVDLAHSLVYKSLIGSCMQYGTHTLFLRVLVELLGFWPNEFLLVAQVDYFEHAMETCPSAVLNAWMGLSHVGSQKLRRKEFARILSDIHGMGEAEALAHLNGTKGRRPAKKAKKA